MKYIFIIQHRNSELKVNDTFEEWITAGSAFEAKQQMEKAYPTKLGYTCTLVNEQ